MDKIDIIGNEVKTELSLITLNLCGFCLQFTNTFDK